MKENVKGAAAKGGWRVVTFDNFHFMDGGDGGGCGPADDTLSSPHNS